MKKEVFFNLILTILVSLMGFIQNKYFIKYLGVEVLGIMKLFINYFNILIL